MDDAIRMVLGAKGNLGRILIAGGREGFTEWGQFGLENLITATAKGIKSMFSRDGLEMWIAGFTAGGTITAGGRTINAALRSDDNSQKEFNNYIDALYDLNIKKLLTKDEDLQDVYNVQIQNIENEFKNFLNNTNKLSQYLTEEQKTELTNILKEKNNITDKKQKLKTKLDNNIINKGQYNDGIATLEGFNQTLDENLNIIKNQALEAASKRQVEIVKTQIKEMGLEGEVKEMTADEISKMDLGKDKDGSDVSKKASDEFGFIRQFKDDSFEIIINKDKPALGTAAHEFLHAVIFKTLGKDNNITNELSSALIDHVTKLKATGAENLINRLQAYEGDPDFNEEVITVMSESILDGSLKYDEGFFVKIGDILRRFFKGKLGYEYEFNTGRDVYNFIKDYNESIKTGKINKAIIKVAKEGAKGELIDKGKAQTKIEAKTETKAKPTETIKKSKSQNPQVDALGDNKKWNNKTWKETGADQALTAMESKNMLSGLIAAKYKVRPIPDNFIKKVYSEITQHVRNFKPEQNDSLFGWINSFLKFKAGNVFIAEQRGAKPKDIKAVEADARTTEGQPVIQVEDVSANMETLTDNINYFETEVQPENTESKAEQSKLRVELGIKNLGKGEIFKKVRTALATSKAIDEKGFLNSYEKNLANLLEPTIARILNDPAKLKKFRKGILESIPIKTLVQMQKFLPEKIFVKDHGRQTNLTNLSKFVEKGLLPADILNNTPESKKRRAAGVRVYERLDTTTKQFENYIDAPVIDPKTGKRSGTRGNNRAKVISEVAKAIGKDATPETLTPEFVEDYLNIKDLKGKITPEKVIEKISEQVERPSALKFSKSQKKGFYMGAKDLAKYLSEKTGIPVSRLESFIRYSGDKATYNGIFNSKTGESVMDAKIRFTIQFLEENPQFRDYLMKSGLGSVSRSTYGSEQFFMNMIKDTFSLSEKEIKLVRHGYLKDKKQQPKKINLSEKQQAIENKKLDNLKDYFIAVQEFLKTNPEAAALFISFYQDGGSAGMGSTVRVSFPYRIYTIDQRTRKANYIAPMREEHNHPANQIHSALLFAAMEGNVEQVFPGIRASMMQGSITIKADNLINDGSKNIYGEEIGLKNGAPDIWFDEILPKVMSGELKLEDGMGAVVRLAIQGVNLNELMIVGTDQTIAEYFGVGIDTKNMTDAQIERLIPIQNDLVIQQQTGEITKEKASNKIKDAVKLYTTIKISESQIKKSKNTRKAHNNRIKYSKSGESRGMSTFDFDDTLARTKSGVRYTMPNLEGNPAPGRKVIFLAGGAGSGKSNVVKQLGLEKQGFKIVNQDISLEWLAKNSGLPTNMRDFTPEQASEWGSLQWEARDIAQKKQMKFKGRGDGIIVDGTGANKISMDAQVMKFRNSGYDVHMIFVETSLDVALERNRARKERSLKDFIVERNWKQVQANKKAFKEKFGNNFAEVNTDNLKQGDPMPIDLTKKINDFTSGYIKGRLTAEEFASQGDALLSQGAEFDFSEFNKVVDGTPGPLLEKARNRAEKYGTKDMFVLTARPQASALAIQQFLKGQGLNIPIGNITGLANSTGEAKANWMLEKFAEGYNDMYFVDDALQNVKAVKDVLNQLDIKSEVVQAKIKFSKSAPLEFNEILEQTKKVAAGKVFSAAEARKIGAGKGKNIFKNFFVPPSAEDFKGLLYAFIGRGEQGNAHAKFFKENLLDPFAKANREWNTYKQSMSNDYKALKKQFKNVGKILNNKVKGTNFTNQDAIRVYLWDKAGFNIPGLSLIEQNKLVNYINNNSELEQFAEGLSVVSKATDGYIQPSKFWSIESIASDLNNAVSKLGRKDFFAEWINNKNIIFSLDNLNKVEAIYGTGFRNELEKILYRMETGRNRLTGKDTQVNMLLDWINGSVGAVMFFNMRSATLQTISMANFINMSDNNPVAAAAALANAPQFIKDFAFIFNSDMLKQRRAGLQIDISASELTRAFKDGKSKPQAIIHWLLEKGFKPTQIADSFAIAAGGAPFYRNRLKAYLKQGMSEAQAKEQAWLDFQEVAEETQQSSRPDLISNQQAGPLGRLILAWQNTPMQMTRLMKKKLSDFVNRRRIPGYTQFQSDMANISGIAYYGLIQNIYFGALQTGLMFMLFGWDDDEEKKERLEKRVANGALDSILRGTGIYGAGISTLKNVLLKWKEEADKPGWKRENMNIAQEAVNLSPPMGTKMRKIMQAVRTEEWNKGVSKEIGWRIENPNLSIAANWVEALTNLPVARIIHKANNIEEALTGNHQLWQKIALISGWSKWSLGVEDEELEKAKVKVKEQRAADKKTEKKEKKKQEEIDKKKKGIKTVRCSGIRSNGKRCSLTTETKAKTWKCIHHMDFKDGMDRDNDGIKEYRCTATTSSGKRCRNKTENKNKKCYAHQ